MANGKIVNPGMLDTLSVIGYTAYNPLAIGGVTIAMEGDEEGNKAIMTTNGTGNKENAQVIQIMDVEQSDGTYPPVPGVSLAPPAPPTPPSIDRPKLVEVENTRVFFGDGKGNHYRVAVSGDCMTTQLPTVPPLRPIIENVLTSPTLYPTIIIGTRTI